MKASLLLFFIATFVTGSGALADDSYPTAPGQSTFGIEKVHTLVRIADGDNDGIEDADDNCLSVANADQRDTDADGFGNRCDSDFNNDCAVNFVDVSAFSNQFLSDAPLFDLDGNGSVNFVDLSLLGEQFLLPPGPSGTVSECQTQEPGDLVRVVPGSYNRALKNPLKGFTAGNDGSHEWASLSHKYFKWNELENDISDGIDKILAVSNQKFGNANQHNIKIIPRVYLHWNGANEKYWPADMVTDDYDSPQFQARVTRLVQRLGEAWNDDPRIAFVELGIFGKWGEHHSPDPTQAMQDLVGQAFVDAFPDKLVSVRQIWNDFQGFGFGEYWDSWAHQQQMWPDGGGTAAMNANSLRYLNNYIGGEVAYNWGDWQTQPGESPTDSVSDPVHREFIENSIRWLHCTQLRWISAYDDDNPVAQAGAEKLQRAMGYRFVLDEVAFTPSVLNGVLNFEATITNEGSAPFYYDWPVELALHNAETREIVWSSTLNNTDVRDWLPGSNWTGPDWVESSNWPGFVVAEGWSDSVIAWNNPPLANQVTAQLPVDAPDGEYVLTIAVLDPASMRPSLRFATSNYWNGGRHPVGRVAVGSEGGGLLDQSSFDDPINDDSISY
ncbi:MAG: DUF4832 domain-containing protein [Gammaproteobacteria bacterium]